MENQEAYLPCVLNVGKKTRDRNGKTSCGGLYLGSISVLQFGETPFSPCNAVCHSFLKLWFLLHKTKQSYWLYQIQGSENSSGGFRLPSCCSHAYCTYKPSSAGIIRGLSNQLFHSSVYRETSESVKSLFQTDKVQYAEKVDLALAQLTLSLRGLSAVQNMENMYVQNKLKVE